MGIAVVLAMQLVSATFQARSAIPMSMVSSSCGGRNVMPELSWSGAPARTKSFALLLHDPDAPRVGGFYHLVLYDLPPALTRLDAGSVLPARSTGTNSTGASGYFGPCPPPGKAHHYVFTVYALDVPSVRAPAPLTGEQLLARMKGHVLAQASLVGLFATH
jgi:Raf kinase inhibitor-like YbhB/YbcL family protein